MTPKARWTRWVIETSAADIPLPWVRIRRPHKPGLGMRA
jgi:hypothetical protein